MHVRRRGRPRTAWMDNIKTWTGLSVEESIKMTEDRDKWETTSMVWPTLGSRTAKEQNRTPSERPLMQVSVADTNGWRSMLQWRHHTALIVWYMSALHILDSQAKHRCLSRSLPLWRWALPRKFWGYACWKIPYSYRGCWWKVNTEPSLSSLILYARGSTKQ